MAKALPTFAAVDYALRLTNGNISRAAARIGCSRTTIYKMLDLNGYREHNYADPEHCAHCHGHVPAPVPATAQVSDAADVTAQIVQVLVGTGLTLEIAAEWSAHWRAGCSSAGCGICGQVAQRLQRVGATREHTLHDCWCGREHVATAPRQNANAATHAPRRPASADELLSRYRKLRNS